MNSDTMSHSFRSLCRISNWLASATDLDIEFLLHISEEAAHDLGPVVDGEDDVLDTGL